MTTNYPCRTCKYYTYDHYCSNERLLDHNGNKGLARHVFYVVMHHGNGTPGCSGQFFEPIDSI